MLDNVKAGKQIALFNLECCMNMIWDIDNSAIRTAITLAFCKDAGNWRRKRWWFSGRF